jgi:hypothetical protein
MFKLVFMFSMIFIIACSGLDFVKQKKSENDELIPLKLLIESNVQKYTPKKDKQAILMCSVINKTDKAIIIDTSLSYTNFGIYGRGEGHPFDSYLWKYEESENEEKEVILKSGEKILIFQSLLDNLFFGHEEMSNNQNKDVWIWGWSARPEPPLSPIHIWRGEGYVESATFWFCLRINDKLVESNKLTLGIIK